MIGRLSPNRGKFGIIICRDIANENLMIQRCRDAYLADQGLIIPLTDNDIITILEKKKEGIAHHEDEILSLKSRSVMN